MNSSFLLEIIKASEIEPKEVKWLWYPYIPFGKVTLLQGDPDDGKSKLMLSIAALLSNGEPLPFTDEEETEPIEVNARTLWRLVMKIEHIALYVKDLETARDFFVKYLGAKSNKGYHNLKTGFRSYFLSFDDGARLEIMNKPEMPDFPKEFAHTGYAHIAFSVGSKEKVNALTAELKADGYEVVSGPRTTGDGYYESCIAAIEGNQIEITV